MSRDKMTGASASGAPDSQRAATETPSDVRTPDGNAPDEKTPVICPPDGVAPAGFPGVDLSRFALAREAMAAEPAQKPEKPKKKPRPSRCDDCEFFDTDEWGDGVCSMSLDEDEMAEFSAGHTGRCPYYRYYNEYKSVQKQN